MKAAIPAGQRVYAVGDIHGRLDLLVSLAEAIEADDRARGPADTTVILLGDLVDRGPDSAGVIKAVHIPPGAPVEDRTEEVSTPKWLSNRKARTTVPVS